MEELIAMANKSGLEIKVESNSGHLIVSIMDDNETIFQLSDEISEMGVLLSRTTNFIKQYN